MKQIHYPIIILLISCSQQTKSIHQVESESRKNQPRVNLSKIKVGLDVLIDEHINLIKNKAIGAASTQRNHTTNPPSIAPKLFPVPPTITITHITKVYLIGR